MWEVNGGEVQKNQRHGRRFSTHHEETIRNIASLLPARKALRDLEAQQLAVSDGGSVQ